LVSLLALSEAANSVNVKMKLGGGTIDDKDVGSIDFSAAGDRKLKSHPEGTDSWSNEKGQIQMKEHVSEKGS
jgi:hypothetical protein